MQDNHKTPSKKLIVFCALVVVSLVASLLLNQKYHFMGPKELTVPHQAHTPASAALLPPQTPVTTSAETTQTPSYPANNPSSDTAVAETQASVQSEQSLVPTSTADPEDNTTAPTKEKETSDSAKNTLNQLGKSVGNVVNRLL